MVKSSLLFVSVITLFIYIIIGFVLRKTNRINGSFATSMSLYVMYIAQVAMLIQGFIEGFNTEVFKGICWVLLFSFISHTVFYFIAINIFKKAPETLKKVLRFGLVFSNAGYMGIPVINDVFGSEYVIYATVYVIMFNIFCFSVGRLIYTGDKSYMSFKSIIVNPAVIPILIGLIIYVTGFGGYLINQIENGTGAAAEGLRIIYGIITTLKNTVAPATMLLIGCRLAEINFKGFFKDKYLYKFLALRHIILPFIMWCIMFLFHKINIFNDDVAMSIVFILNTTPAAAATTMFAELYNGDSRYAGKLVAVSTVFSVITMPLMANLLLIK